MAAAAAQADGARRGRAASTQGWINEGFASDDAVGALPGLGAPLVEGYVAGLDPADEPVGVERTVATRTDVIAVSGRIDRLDAGRGPTRGRHRTRRGRLQDRPPRAVSVDDARSSLALAIYAIAASRALRRDCRRVELHHLPTGQVLAWDAHARSRCSGTCGGPRTSPRSAPTRTSGCARRCPRTKYDEVFPPRPAPGCGWCDYLRHCPEGQAAAVSRRPWDALAEL